ncbi:hypothetical protein ACQJBY_022958 [Aegilops geniculata]
MGCTTCGYFTWTKDPCVNTTTVCSKIESLKDKLIPRFSFVISLIILFCPILRIKDLKPDPQSDSQTFFWWFLFIGFLGYILWLFYFWECYHPDHSAFPVLLTCISGLVIHLALCVKVQRKTKASGDQRVVMCMVLTFVVLVLGATFLGHRQALGWMGVTLSEYYNKMNWCLFVASVVGSVNGFLWLIHPQLCISKEYKNYRFISLMVTGDTNFVAY